MEPQTPGGQSPVEALRLVAAHLLAAEQPLEGEQPLAGEQPSEAAPLWAVAQPLEGEQVAERHPAAGPPHRHRPRQPRSKVWFLELFRTTTGSKALLICWW